MRNMEQTRFNMVEQQIRPWNVLDAQVLELFMQVKRELFVPAEKRALAFMDLEVPLGNGAKMWAPKIEARALQALQLKSSDRVMEVGTGSGYFTALLANLAEHVTSVEIVPELGAQAAKNLAAQHIVNVTLEIGDAADGWGEQQFDAIVLTGSVPVAPQKWMNQLKIGGRLFAIVGEGATMQGMLFTRTAAETFQSAPQFEAVAAPLVNAPQPKRFVF